jgi:hypothetical protein
MPWTTPKTWAAGEVLTAANLNLYLRDNTEMMGASRPAARVFQSTGTTLTSGVGANLLFDSEVFDVGALHSTSLNTDRMTISIAGLYLFQATVSFPPNATGYRRATINNQAGGTIATDTRAAFGTFNNEVNLAGIDRLNPGNWVAVQATQSSGGNLTTVANFTSFSCVWIGPS